MNVLVLGGCGIQGKAALYDLPRNPKACRIICADIRTDSVQTLKYVDHSKISTVQLNLERKNELISLMKENIDVVIDFLPPRFVKPVAKTALESGVSLVKLRRADVLWLPASEGRPPKTIFKRQGLHQRS
jgi:saccharopine dehydrogenase-like NADP-dependent oxidoreductase